MTFSLNFTVPANQSVRESGEPVLEALKLKEQDNYLARVGLIAAERMIADDEENTGELHVAISGSAYQTASNDGTPTREFRHVHINLQGAPEWVDSAPINSEDVGNGHVF